MAAEAITLLERASELSAMADAVEAVRAGAGRLVVVEGQAGIGKSRLLDALRQQAARAGCTVLPARGTPLEREVTFGVVRQLFEARLSSADAAQQRRWLEGPAADLVATLAGVTGLATEGAQGDFTMLHALYWLTANLSQDAPVLLAVDDIHWADAPSLRFLTYLAGRLVGLPVLLAVALRTDEVSTLAGPLLGHLVTEPDRLHLVPQFLSPAAVADLVRTIMTDGDGDETDAAFVDACHRATNGNPLLLTELLSIAAAENWRPTAADADRVLEVGARAVARHVALRLGRLSARAVALARAVTVLGDDCTMEHAAALAGQDLTVARAAAGELHRAGLVDTVLSASNPGSGRAAGSGTVGGADGPPIAGPRLRYQHPLIGAAVEHDLPLDERTDGHARAAAVLWAQARHDPETAAAHLLRITATGDPEHVVILQAAADQAVVRGAADTALTYLRRCLAEPLSRDRRAGLLARAGTTALPVDAEQAADSLRRAMELTEDMRGRAHLASELGVAWLMLQRHDQAEQAWSAALAELDAAGNDPDCGTADDELGTTLRGQLLSLALVVPGRTDLLAHAGRLEYVRGREDAASRGVAGLLACLHGYAGDRDGIAWATQAIDADVLAHRGRWQHLVCAWNCLVFADDPRVVPSLDAAMATAHRTGAVSLLISALTYRVLWSLHRGELADVEADGRECLRLTDLSNMDIARVHIGPWLAAALVEQGRVEEAAAALDWVGVEHVAGTGARHHYLLTLARLRTAQGDHDAALAAALDAGADYSAHHGRNPAVMPWRSQAAVNLHALGDDRGAQEYAATEVVTAADWGAPTAVGRAHRVAGLVHHGPVGLAHLRTAVAVLSDAAPAAQAKLELAKACVDLGAALRRTGQRSAALHQLRTGAALAQRCGAEPVLELAHAEIRAAGARPRRDRNADGSALTESERRVAALAAQGHTNRFIAQQLFVTTKTVEVHLGSVYRKLGITRRELTPERLHPLPTEDGRAADGR